MKTRKPAAADTSCTTESDHFPSVRPFLKHWVIVQMQGLQTRPSQFPFLPPPAERLDLIRTHWCVDNEGVTGRWERPGNSPHRGSGFLGGVWVSTPAPWCMHSCELVTAFTQIQGQTWRLHVLYRYSTKPSFKHFYCYRSFSTQMELTHYCSCYF